MRTARRPSIPGFIFLGEGRNRAGYLRGNTVLKVPLNDAGIFDNRYEHRQYRRYLLGPDMDGKYDIHYARCRLWGVCLIMEYAQYPGPLSDAAGYIHRDGAPPWLGSVDCGQAGYNKRGHIVAYDYGYL